MKKILFLFLISLILTQLSYAQSGSIEPNQVDFLNNSTNANIYGLRGAITSNTPGPFSVGVRGENNGTGGNGIGVYGSHLGGGWGIYGTTAGGIGVYGAAGSGIGIRGASNSNYGVNGESATGTAGYFSIAGATNNNPVLHALSAGTGSGLRIQLTNTSNTSNAIDVVQAGSGNGVYVNTTYGNALWGKAGSISAAAVIGDNTTGEAVVGRNRGGGGVGAVVGRNDSTGYGVRGFNTKGGIGVLGQTGVGGGTGVGGRFENVNASNPGSALEAVTNGTGNGINVQVSNTSNATSGIDVSHHGTGAGILANSKSGYGIRGKTGASAMAGIYGENSSGDAVFGVSKGISDKAAVLGRNDSTGVGVRGYSTKNGVGILGQAGVGGGAGKAGRFENTNAANGSTTLEVASNGYGSGITIQLSNNSNSGRGIDIIQSGVGSGVYSTSAGGMALWGVTNAATAAGVIGDNTYGEAVVGRNRGANGVGAVVGRNDSTGYGVRGFNTKAGIGVIGQAGINGGTGRGGRFENVNASNTSNALEASTNGTGAGAYMTNTNAGGNGSGLVAEKSNPYSGAYTTAPNADLEVRHRIFSTAGMSGLRILNTQGSLRSWTFYVNDFDASLSLFAGGNERGWMDASTGAYTATSDARLKTNIQAYGSTLDNLMKVGVKSYQLKNSTKTEVGLLAQEVLPYFPEIVYNRTNDKGEQFYTMDYSRIGVLAVKAIQEQQLTIQEQQQTIKNQQKEIDQLKNDMAELKSLVNSLKK